MAKDHLDTRLTPGRETLHIPQGRHLGANKRPVPRQRRCCGSSRRRQRRPMQTSEPSRAQIAHGGQTGPTGKPRRLWWQERRALPEAAPQLPRQLRRTRQLAISLLCRGPISSNKHQLHQLLLPQLLDAPRHMRPGSGERCVVYEADSFEAGTYPTSLERDLPVWRGHRDTAATFGAFALMLAVHNLLCTVACSSCSGLS